MRALLFVLLLAPVAVALPAAQTPILAITPPDAPALAPHVVFEVDPTTRSGDLLEATPLGQSYTKFVGTQHVGRFGTGECAESAEGVVDCWYGDAPDPHAALRYVRLGADGSFEDWSNGYLQVRGTLVRVV